MVSWTVTSSQPSLPRLSRSFWTSSIIGLLVPSMMFEWIRVFMGMTLYSQARMLRGSGLEFAEVLGFVDVFCQCGFSVFDCGFVVGFAGGAGDDVVGVWGFDFEGVSAFCAFVVHVCASTRLGRSRGLLLFF